MSRRILHLVRPQPLGEVGGAEMHVADLAVEQQRRGLEVMVSHYGNEWFGDLLKARGVTAVVIPECGLHRWRAQLTTIVREYRPSVLHSHGYKADYVAASLRLPARLGVRRRGGPRFVATLHGFVRTTPRLKALTFLNELSLRVADGLITVSAAEAQRIEATRGDAVRYIPNGVAHHDPGPRGYLAERLGRPDSGLRVAFVGRLSEEKRPDLFLRAAVAIAAVHDSALFLVIGAGPMGPGLRQLADRLGLGDRVIFTNLRDDVPQLLSGIDVLTCPSDTEGTPRAVIEAMLAGVAVVATAVGGVPELLDEGRAGRLVEPDSDAALAAAVNELLADPDARQELAERGRRRANAEFGVGQMCDRVVSLYDHIDTGGGRK